MTRAIAAGLGVLMTLAIGGVVLGAAGESGVQKQRYVFKAPAGLAKYEQQHAIDVGDVPGHQIRILEAHSRFTDEAPAYDGVKVKDAWTRAATDYTDGNGRGLGYTLAELENGDKIFGRYESITQTTAGADGAKTTRTNAVTTLTGGTGKFKGIRGTIRSTVGTDFKTLGESMAEGEYWIEK